MSQEGKYNVDKHGLKAQTDSKHNNILYNNNYYHIINNQNKTNKFIEKEKITYKYTHKKLKTNFLNKHQTNCKDKTLNPERLSSKMGIELSNVSFTAVFLDLDPGRL